MGWTDFADGAARLRPVAAATFRLIGTALIAYLFIIVLISASAQNGVAARLGKLEKPLDYSAAYAQLPDADVAKRTLKNLRDQERDLEARRIVAARTASEGADELAVQMGPLRTLMRRVVSIPGCAVSNAPAAEIGQINEVLSILRQCVGEPGTPPDLKLAIETGLAATAPDGRNLAQIERDVLLANREIGTIGARLERVVLARRNHEQLVAAMQPIVDSFGELAVLRQSWMVGGNVIAEFPPSMMHIVLAFVSGLFGGLLLTLVLVVYPKNGIVLSGGGGFGARILLGGLISLCVFVVIGGGTAVLGTNGAFADGDANFLAFCAIGILAGMFSDRVASWLSQRADMFFSDKRLRDGTAGPEDEPAATGNI